MSESFIILLIKYRINLNYNIDIRRGPSPGLYKIKKSSKDISSRNETHMEYVITSCNYKFTPITIMSKSLTQENASNG